METKEQLIQKKKTNKYNKWKLEYCKLVGFNYIALELHILGQITRTAPEQAPPEIHMEDIEATYRPKPQCCFS